MRGLLLIAVLFGVLAASASGAATRVVLMNTSPAAVGGIGFDRSAPVHITVAFGSHRLTKTVQSTSTGSFIARWPATTLPANACTQLVISATSAHHSVAVKTVESADGCGAQRVTP